MVVQEFIRWEQYVRCLCLNRADVLPMRYDPHQRRYIEGTGYLGAALRQR